MFKLKGALIHPPSPTKVFTAQSVEPFSMLYAQCVEYTKTSTLTLTLTLTVIGFKTVTDVRYPNPKHNFSSHSSIWAVGGGKALFRIRVAPAKPLSALDALCPSESGRESLFRNPRNMTFVADCTPITHLRNHS